MELLTTAIDVWNGGTVTMANPETQEAYLDMAELEENEMTALQKEEFYMARGW